MTILTAANPVYQDCLKYCVRSIKRYCEQYPDIQWISERIPAFYPKIAGWFKIDAIRRALRSTDYVLWIDADALIVGTDDFRDLIHPYTLNIAKDAHGINCGVMAWKNCLESFEALDRIEALHPKFAEHPWMEQAALHTFVDQLDVFYQPKHIWNAYLGGVGEADESADTMILHCLGAPTHRRAIDMQKRFQQSTNERITERYAHLV